MGVGAPSHRLPASSGPQAAVDPTPEEPLPAGRRGRFPMQLCPRQPRWLLPAGCRFPRGRQYVETPPHSSGCPLPFRRLGLGTQGGPAFRALPGGPRSSLMTHQPWPVTRVGGRAGAGWLSTAPHWQTPRGRSVGRALGPHHCRLSCTWPPDPRRAHLPPRPLCLALGMVLYRDDPRLQLRTGDKGCRPVS